MLPDKVVGICWLRSISKVIRPMPLSTGVAKVSSLAFADQLKTITWLSENLR